MSLSFCKTCQNRLKCVKSCVKIEDYLRSKGIYRIDYIRKRMDKGMKWREVAFSALDIEGQKMLENLTKDGLKERFLLKRV